MSRVAISLFVYIYIYIYIDTDRLFQAKQLYVDNIKRAEDIFKNAKKHMTCL